MLRKHLKRSEERHFMILHLRMHCLRQRNIQILWESFARLVQKPVSLSMIWMLSNMENLHMLP